MLDARFGGNTTASWLRLEPYNYYGEMALNIQQENVQNFVEGRRLFHTDFTNGQHSDPGNPVLTKIQNMAGPLDNTTSCENCHFRNSPGFQATGPIDAATVDAYAGLGVHRLVLMRDFGDLAGTPDGARRDTLLREMEATAGRLGLR